MGRLILLVKYKMKSGSREAFVDEVTSSGILEKIKREDGFVSYDYYYDAVDPNSLLLMEEWQSEAQQQQHLLSSHMQALKQIKDKYVLSTSVRQCPEH